jgi:ATP-dependent RNA helicase DeaD
VAESFTGLGLSEALARAAQRAGYETATPLQAASFAVLRRGGNVVLHASSGAGVTAAFGLPLLERVGDSEGTGVRALVLAPTPERAVRIADTLGQLAADTAVRVRAAAPGWRTGDAHVLVSTPERAIADVQASALKLEQLEAWVLVDVAEMLALKAKPALDTIAGLIPRDAQRVLTSGEITSDIEKLIESHARRALTVPPRPADPTTPAKPAESAGQIGYLVTSDAEKPEMLARLLEGAGDAVVYVRNALRVDDVAAELRRRGAGGTGVNVVPFGATARAERVISYDVPFSADELKRVHANGGTVFVDPAQLAHLKRIAAEAAFTLKQRRAKELDATELDAFRALVRNAVSAEDLQAQLLVLEPLFDESSPAEVAAALSALLRRRTPPPAARSAAAPPSAATGAPPAAATTSAFTRLFLSIGSRDNIRPGDLVGAITGEAGIKGEQVGRVDIRDSFSVVEVQSPVAEKVIRALNGTTMRGRSLRVDFDRKGAGEGPSRDAPRGGPRKGGARTGTSGPRRPSSR